MSLALRPQHLARYRDLTRLLVRYGRSDLVSQLGPGALDDDVVTEPVCDDAERLADDLEAMGPTFVKLGQLLSTRVDLLPDAYTQALSRLQDAVAPLPFADIERVVTEELGSDLRHLFTSFDEEPLAAASLAQVHRAVLRSGREVVVKIQRPDVRATIRTDMEALAGIAELFDRHTDLGRRYGFGDLLEQFRTALVAELDYLREAANLTTLARIVEPWPRLVVPRPVPDYSTGRVLTMDYLEGRKVTSLGPLARLDVEGAPLVDDLFRAYLQQILVDGFFHADPHPGNVLLTTDGRLALIDLGMVATLGTATQDGIVRLLLAIADGRGDAAAVALAALGRKGEDFRQETFEQQVGELVTTSVQRGRDVEAGAVVVELSRISAQCGMRPPPELAMVGKALLNLDQVAACLDPDFAPAEAVRRHTAAILQSRMSTSPAGLMAAAMEAKDFTMALPGRVNKVLDTFSDGHFEVKVHAIDEAQFLSVLQRLANRLTSGLVLAALVVGAALMMQIPTRSRLLGYPSVAIICFLLAATGGAAMLVSIMVADRRIARAAKRSRSRP